MFFPRHHSPCWSKSLRIVVAGLACACGVASASAQATKAARVRVTNSFREVAPVGEAVSANSATAETVRDSITPEEAAATIEVQLPLRTRNAAELERRVAAGETISREEMSARYLPAESDFQVVADWLTSEGLTVLPMGASRSMVIAQGARRQLAAAFETHFARVQYKGEQHTSITEAPSLPTAIEARVHGVHGLQPHLHPRKHLTQNPINIANGQPPFLPDDILKAYNVASTGLDGSGQTIGIIIDSVPLTSDVTHYWTYNGVPQDLSRYSTVNVNGRQPGQRMGEETLDVEWASGIASGANVVVYNCGDLDYSNDAYARALDDLQSGAQPTLHQLSISFGAGETSGETTSDINAVHSLFTSIAAYGVSIFCSSGDEGAYANATTGGRVEAIYPASDPIATGVGATSLYLNNDSSWQAENAWSVASGARKHDSSGGGISTFFSRPSWQTGTGVNTGAMRQVPDVSLAGDPNTGYYVYYNGKVEQDGGTSIGTPCWAGLCALLNQARAKQGQSPINNLNALLYPLLGSSALHDITIGTNGVYSCGTGYDLLTGIGSPNFAALVQQLVGTTAAHPAFFTGETALSGGVYYLAFPNNGNIFGYYSYLSDPHYIYHQDMGFEYWFDAADGRGGLYLYDFKSGHFFYTSPVYSFPYLYDFSLGATLYYYPDPSNPQRYNTNGVRYFYNFNTGRVITE